MKGRRAILQAHATGKPLAEAGRALEIIAQTTPGMSGADLANLLNEAAILCAQRNAAEITLADLEAARDKVRFCKEHRSMVLRQQEREMIVFHEASRTILHLQTALLPPRYKVSIVPRGQALGVTTLLPDEDQNLQSKKFLLEELLVLMGGWAAEKTFYDSTTSGAAGAFYGFLPITFFVTLAHILDLRTPPGRAMSYAMERCGELMCGLYRRIAFEVRLATL